MGYRIEYGERKGNKTSVKSIALLMAGVVVSALLLWPEGRIALQEMLLPGDAEVTASALQGLASDLVDGESLSEAVATFCQEIIAGDR